MAGKEKAPEEPQEAPETTDGAPAESGTDEESRRRTRIVRVEDGTMVNATGDQPEAEPDPERGGYFVRTPGWPGVVLHSPGDEYPDVSSEGATLTKEQLEAASEDAVTFGILLDVTEIGKDDA